MAILFYSIAILQYKLQYFFSVLWFKMCSWQIVPNASCINKKVRQVLTILKLLKDPQVTFPKATCSQTVSSTSFFAGIAVKRQKLAGEESDVAAEVDKYLADASNELQSLNMYPHVKEQYITLNTTLPASAAVERLFSLGGRIFLPTRSRLSSEHFEMMMFLRMAKWWLRSMREKLCEQRYIWCSLLINRNSWNFQKYCSIAILY